MTNSSSTLRDFLVVIKIIWFNFLVAAIPVYSSRGLRDTYEKFMTSPNFSIWIQRKTESINRDWKYSYLALLGGVDVVAQISALAKVSGWSDAVIIDIFGRLVTEIVYSFSYKLVFNCLG